MGDPLPVFKYGKDFTWKPGHIGQGFFGDVRLGQLMRAGKKPRNVAIKMYEHTKINPSIIEKSAQDSRQISQGNSKRETTLVHVYGLVKEARHIGIVMDYMPQGDLVSFLTDPVVQQRCRSDPEKLMAMCLDIADAVDEIHSYNFVHGDICAKSCLVKLRDPNRMDFVVRLSDMGIGMKCQAYVSPARPKPYRWCAPEIVQGSRNFNKDTDVFSLGVTLWEVYSFGQQPFSGMTISQLMMSYHRGTVPLAQPPNCPQAMWDLIKKCIVITPDKRTTAERVANKICEIGKYDSDSESGTDYSDDD